MDAIKFVEEKEEVLKPNQERLGKLILCKEKLLKTKEVIKYLEVLEAIEKEKQDIILKSDELYNAIKKHCSHPMWYLDSDTVKCIVCHHAPAKEIANYDELFKTKSLIATKVINGDYITSKNVKYESIDASIDEVLDYYYELLMQEDELNKKLHEEFPDCELLSTAKFSVKEVLFDHFSSQKKIPKVKKLTR